jgi:hypothetical protein
MCIYYYDIWLFRFIQELGKALGLRHDTMATAAVYFHRFYMFHSFIEFPRYVSLLFLPFYITSRRSVLFHRFLKVPV